MYSIYLYNIKKRIAGSEAALNSRYIYLVTEFVNYSFLILFRFFTNCYILIN